MAVLHWMFWRHFSRWAFMFFGRLHLLLPNNQPPAGM